MMGRWNPEYFPTRLHATITFIEWALVYAPQDITSGDLSISLLPFTILDCFHQTVFFSSFHIQICLVRSQLKSFHSNLSLFQKISKSSKAGQGQPSFASPALTHLNAGRDSLNCGVFSVPTAGDDHPSSTSRASILLATKFR